MPAYVVVEVEVRDSTRFEEYKRLAPRVITADGGRYLSRGGRTDVLEGDAGPDRIVILEFPSLERARECWASSEYEEANALRQSCSRARMMTIEGP